VIKKEIIGFIMSDTQSKIRHLQYNTAAWTRALEFILQENAFLKTRLAEILKLDDTAADYLETIEHYQSSFVRNDEIINLMRRDIDNVEKLLAICSNGDGRLAKSVLQKLKKLNGELKELEKNFNSAKIKFNNYLEEILQINGN
jgi:hypothetical protein